MGGVLSLQLGSLEWTSAFVGFGQKLLGIAFAAMFLKETAGLLKGGRADLFTPVAKLALAAAVLKGLPGLAEMVARAGLTLADVISKDTWDDAWNAAQQQMTESARAELSSVFVLTPTLLLSMGTFFLGLVMQAVSYVIGVLWQVAMTCLILAGYLVIPLALIPGAGLTVRSWVKSLIEVSLWPVVFATVQRVSVSCFEAALARISELPAIWSSEGALASVENQKLLVQFWAMQLIFLFATILTPVLAMFVVRGTPVGVAVGSAMAAGMRVVGGAAGFVGGSALGARITSGAAGTWQKGAAAMAGSGGGGGGRPGPAISVAPPRQEGNSSAPASPPAIPTEDKRSAGDAARLDKE